MCVSGWQWQGQQIRSWQSPIWPIQRSRPRDTLQVTGSSYAIRYVPDRPRSEATVGTRRELANSDHTQLGRSQLDTLSLSTKVLGIPGKTVLEA